MEIIAAAIVIVSSVLTAYNIIRKENMHCRCLEKMTEMLSAVKNMASFYNTPFSESINELDTDKYFYSGFKKCFAENIRGGLSVPEAWNNAVDSDQLHLKQYEADIIKKFATELCSCNKEEIENIACKAIEDINEFKKTADENKRTRSRSAAAITVSVGIIIVLVFA